MLIEAMTYRIGHHSTSDDSSAYRSVDEVRVWHQRDHPINRTRKYMEHNNWWNEEMEKSWKEEAKRQVMSAFANAEKQLKPNWIEMFTDVYHQMPEHLKQQSEELRTHLEVYKEHYPINSFKT